MTTKYKIKDNFLLEKDFLKIEKTFTDSFNLSNFPWYFSLNVGNPNKDKDIKKDVYHSYFIHSLYNNGITDSHHIKVLEPLFNKLKVKRLTRAKVNLFLPTSKLHYFDTHIDSTLPGNRAAILYINSCDGGTFMEEKTLIKSKRNRLLKFKSNIPHCSTSCTNSRYRMLININYYI
jgi:hypothetical protein|tara:strand:+ start:953 stop:1480 length:528 start_codon:yes stop_codon:yes gene_type:complete